jgi:hypothetical protein
MPLPWQSGSSNSMRAEPMAAARSSASASSGRVDLVKEGLSGIGRVG